MYVSAMGLVRKTIPRAATALLRKTVPPARGGRCEKGFSHQPMKGFSHQAKGLSHQDRRAVERGTAGVLVVAMLGAVSLIGQRGTTQAAVPEWEMVEVGDRGGGDGDPACLVFPLAGPPRAWETGIEVATYCTANAVNHNLFTEIPTSSPKSPSWHGPESGRT